MGLNIESTLFGASTELTADDLTGGPKFLVIMRMEKTEDPKRPLSVFYHGDDKPWRPCLTMRRVLAGCFGLDADAYIRQVVEVYRDNRVTYGEKGQGVQPVGGVRFKRASIKERLSISVQASRGKRTTWTVDPISAAELQRILASVPAAQPAAPVRRMPAPAAAAPAPPPADDGALARTLDNIRLCTTPEALAERRAAATAAVNGGTIKAPVFQQIMAAINARAAELTTTTTTEEK